MVTQGGMLEAYFDCRKTKRGKDSALWFETDYETLTADLTREINDRTYEIGTSTAFIVTRPKLREVFAADFRDRVVHHWLAIRLEPLFERLLIEDTYNCRKGKGTQYGVERIAEKVRLISENYTRDCYVGKFDMQGFFMSIHKPTLWTMLEEFIYMNYKGRDINDVLWLTKKVVLHCPEKNCVRHGSISLWNSLPPEKSLFTNGDDYGLPIGNLTSQMFANFYLHFFDVMMTGLFGDGYGRYVDDFAVVSTSKEDILKCIAPARDYLWDNLQIRLHPEKIYIQHYTKGVKFTGSVIKPHRIYTGNQTVGNFLSLIDGLNRDVSDADTEQAVCRINSYLGFLGHTSSYTIRRRMMEKELDPRWYKRLYIKGHYRKAVARHGERKRSQIINNIKERKELW